MKKTIVVCLISLLSACSSVSNLFPPEQELAVKVAVTDTFKELDSLPKPAGKIPVSVYSFRDQTGQYKPKANVSSFSTAVTLR